MSRVTENSRLDLTAVFVHINNLTSLIAEYPLGGAWCKYLMVWVTMKISNVYTKNYAI